MARMTISQEVENLILAGYARKSSNNSFVGKDGKPMPMKDMDFSSDPLDVDDVFVVPKDYQTIDIRFNKDTENFVKCVFVEVTCADGTIRNWRFYPSMLCKSRIPIVVVDGHATAQARVKTTGTAVDLFCSATTIDEGMAKIAGKRIRVTAKTPITYRDYVTKELRETFIYTYDLVDEA